MLIKPTLVRCHHLTHITSRNWNIYVYKGTDGIMMQDLFILVIYLKADDSILINGCWVWPMLTMLIGFIGLGIVPIPFAKAAWLNTFLLWAFPEQCISKSTCELHCSVHGLHQNDGVSGTLCIKRRYTWDFLRIETHFLYCTYKVIVEEIISYPRIADRKLSILLLESLFLIFSLCSGFSKCSSNSSLFNAFLY